LIGPFKSRKRAGQVPGTSDASKTQSMLRELALQWVLGAAVMSLVRIQGLTCTFCKKSQQDANKLIASPDKHTYICDECTVELGRLKPVGCDPDKLISTPSLLSRLSNLIRRSRSSSSQEQLRCSFCRNKKSTLGFYRSALRNEIHARICGECLEVCRQILKDEAKRDLALRPYQPGCDNLR
jgi:hypothetical protein